MIFFVPFLPNHFGPGEERKSLKFFVLSSCFISFFFLYAPLWLQSHFLHVTHVNVTSNGYFGRIVLLFPFVESVTVMARICRAFAYKYFLLLQGLPAYSGIIIILLLHKYRKKKNINIRYVYLNIYFCTAQQMTLTLGHKKYIHIYMFIYILWLKYLILKASYGSRQQPLRMYSLPLLKVIVSKELKQKKLWNSREHHREIFEFYMRFARTLLFKEI